VVMHKLPMAAPAVFVMHARMIFTERVAIFTERVAKVLGHDTDSADRLRQPT